MNIYGLKKKVKKITDGIRQEEAKGRDANQHKIKCMEYARTVHIKKIKAIRLFRKKCKGG